MCACLDGTPVLTGRQEEGVDPVHDAFVMGRCSVWVDFGEDRGAHDPLCDGGTVHVEIRAR